MVLNDPQGGKRPRAKAWAAELDAARRRAAGMLPDAVIAAAHRLRRLLVQWAAAEVAPGRLVSWLPVAFGAGIAIYFTADHEPTWWAALSLALAGVAVAFLVRRHAVGFPLALGFAAVAVGFATATLHTEQMRHPILAFPTWQAVVTGYVADREERARSDRIVVDVASVTDRRMRVKPQRVRVAVRKGTAPAVGSFVTFKAHLAPPLQPLRPGGYDFARGLYFQGIGASGFVLGRITTRAPPHPPAISLRTVAFVDDLREGIDNRIRLTLDGDRGAIASALITGKRDAISAPVNDAMYVSSLAHVLSISGYHMAVVAGIVFFVIRAGFALAPSLASRRPIKKWAAAGALVAAAFYLVLSGAEVATQRSFIMIAIVLAGVMLDRPALTFRTLAVAAFGVLLLAPEALVHPSFQMSFAATLALVAAYQAYGLPWRPHADSALGARAALWGAREIAGLVLASLIAGLATTPFAAYHFHRLAPYGVLANLFAMPVVSAWVMPMGILGMVALPFGFDGLFWSLMGQGIDWMIAVALWVSHLPGAVGHMRAFGIGPLLLATAGLLLLCLLRSPLRWSGAGFAVAAALWAVAAPRPGVLVAGDGTSAAVRGPDGRLAVLHKGRDTFAIEDWLAADADSRTIGDASLTEGVRCDAIGCVGRLADGRLVAFATDVEAFSEDCTRAAVVISPREGPPGCAALLIDRSVWRGQGAIALYRMGERFQFMTTRPPGYERPWGRGPTSRAKPDLSDATPRRDDLEAGD